MDNDTATVKVPLSPIGIQNLTNTVMTTKMCDILDIHTGIPKNQIRSIIHIVVEETCSQLIAVMQKMDDE